LRWCISSGDDWRLDDGVFDRADFYRMIQALFQDDGGDANNEGEVSWAQDTLKWWNEYAFFFLFGHVGFTAF
jgi:hypothetical protein